MFHNELANLRLASRKSSTRQFIIRRALYWKTALAFALDVSMALESPLVITATRFHAPLMQTQVLLKLDNTATSLSTRFSGAALQRAHSIHFFAAIDRYNALWSSPERSFRRDCARFGYLRSYREQCLSGCYRVWAQATGRSWPILGKVLRDAIMSSLLRGSTYLGSCRRTAQCNENYIVHYRKRSRFSNVPEVIIRQLERAWTSSRCSSARARSIIGEYFTRMQFCPLSASVYVHSQMCTFICDPYCRNCKSRGTVNLFACRHDTSYDTRKKRETKLGLYGRSIVQKWGLFLTHWLPRDTSPRIGVAYVVTFPREIYFISCTNYIAKRANVSYRFAFHRKQCSFSL